jgi:hypothetical protein
VLFGSSFIGHLLIDRGIGAAQLSLPDQGKSPPGIIAVDSAFLGRPRRSVLTRAWFDLIRRRSSRSALLLRCVSDFTRSLS